MDQKEVLKKMIEFNKTSFDNSFSAMVMIQEQTEQMVNTLLDQATWIPAEGKKAIGEWVDSYKKGRETFKKAVDDSFTKLDASFGGAAKGKGK
jgi:division protein CdvB (Snf7/Vps24/ESCRT-III family)